LKAVDAYKIGPLFMSVGDKLFGDTGEDVKGTDWNNPAGVSVLQWIALNYLLQLLRWLFLYPKDQIRRLQSSHSQIVKYNRPRHLQSQNYLSDLLI
jgi:hypothetical protein